MQYRVSVFSPGDKVPESFEPTAFRSVENAIQHLKRMTPSFSNIDTMYVIVDTSTNVIMRGGLLGYLTGCRDDYPESKLKAALIREIYGKSKPTIPLEYERVDFREVVAGDIVLTADGRTLRAEDADGFIGSLHPADGILDVDGKTSNARLPVRVIKEIYGQGKGWPYDTQ